MTPLRPFLPAPSIIGATGALSSTATSLYAPNVLFRGGPAQRALNLHAAGVQIDAAAWMAAKQGKGHVAELAQSIEYSARAGALSRPHHARPNPRANDPRVDVEIRDRVQRVAGTQMKVGSPAYVLNAARRGGYENLVVNSEAKKALERDGHALWAEDRLTHASTEASELSAESCEAQAASALARVLRDEMPVGRLDVILSMARAGMRGALEAVSMTVLVDLTQSFFTGAAFDAEQTVRTALSAAGRATARGAVHVGLLVRQYMAKAGPQFSSRLLHRIARSTLAVGAVADVLVETAIDLVSVLRGRMTFEDLMRRVGVHSFTAAGGAAGLALAAALTKDAPWWAQCAGLLVLGAAGAYCGRQLGSAVFQPAIPVAPQGV